MSSVPSSSVPSSSVPSSSVPSSSVPPSSAPRPSAAHSSAPVAPDRPLRAALVDLAGLPDEDARVHDHLRTIARLAADRVRPIDHASITVRSNGYATVAASSDQALALDRVQYADDAGPCLEALDAGYPASVPDIAATVSWPRFRDTAAGLRVRASLSIPLFAGRGLPIAALNVYGHDPAALAPLSSAVWAAFDPHGAGPAAAPDDGGAELVTGLAGALAARSVIQQALRALMARTGLDALAAYAHLCRRAADASADLARTASRLAGEA